MQSPGAGVKSKTPDLFQVSNQNKKIKDKKQIERLAKPVNSREIGYAKEARKSSKTVLDSRAVDSKKSSMSNLQKHQKQHVVEVRKFDAETDLYLD